MLPNLSGILDKFFLAEAAGELDLAHNPDFLPVMKLSQISSLSIGFIASSQSV